MNYFKDLAERAVATAAQAAVTVMLLDGFNLINATDLKTLGVAALTAAVLAVLKGLAAKGVGNSDDASLVK